MRLGKRDDKVYGEYRKGLVKSIWQNKEEKMQDLTFAVRKERNMKEKQGCRERHRTQRLGRIYFQGTDMGMINA